MRPAMVAVSCVVVPLLLLAGCGSSDNGVASKSAAEVLAAARSAALSASSVHLVSRASVGSSKLTTDATMGRRQAHAQASYLGVSFEAIRIGNTLYVKGNRVFNAHLAHLLGVKIPSNAWLKGPATGALAPADAFTTTSEQLPTLLSERGPLSKGSKVKVDGQPAIELEERAKLFTGTLYVATTGAPYPIQLLRTGQETGQVIFSGWNEPVNVSPPARVLEISQFEHRKER